MNQEFKKQVLRILNRMVKAGEVITKISADGETLYTLAPAQKYTKSKPAGSGTSAALKAWETRRKNKKALETKGKAKSKPSKKGSLAALKAWDTRRKQAKTKMMRKEAAKKAWNTRKKNASNPLLRGKFLK